MRTAATPTAAMRQGWRRMPSSRRVEGVGTAAARPRAAAAMTAAATIWADIITPAPAAIIPAIGLVIIDTDTAIIGVSPAAIDAGG